MINSNNSNITYLIYNRTSFISQESYKRNISSNLISDLLAIKLYKYFLKQKDLKFSYSVLAKKYQKSTETIRRKLVLLESFNLIKREFKTEIFQGKLCNNNMYILMVPLSTKYGHTLSTFSENSYGCNLNVRMIYKLYPYPQNTADPYGHFTYKTTNFLLFKNSNVTQIYQNYENSDLSLADLAARARIYIYLLSSSILKKERYNNKKLLNNLLLSLGRDKKKGLLREEEKRGMKQPKQNDDFKENAYQLLKTMMAAPLTISSRNNVEQNPNFTCYLKDFLLSQSLLDDLKRKSNSNLSVSQIVTIINDIADKRPYTPIYGSETGFINYMLKVLKN